GPAERTLRITSQPNLAEAHAERVIGQQPADQRLADPQDALDGLRRLHQPHHAWEHAQDPGLASAGDEARRWWGGIQAAVARPFVGREDGGHALELEDRAVDVRLVGEVARVVDEIARLEVV